MCVCCDERFILFCIAYHVLHGICFLDDFLREILEIHNGHIYSDNMSGIQELPISLNLVKYLTQQKMNSM